MKIICLHFFSPLLAIKLLDNKLLLDIRLLDYFLTRHKIIRLLLSNYEVIIIIVGNCAQLPFDLIILVY